MYLHARAYIINATYTLRVYAMLHRYTPVRIHQHNIIINVCTRRVDESRACLTHIVIRRYSTYTAHDDVVLFWCDFFFIIIFFFISFYFFSGESKTRAKVNFCRRRGALLFITGTRNAVYALLVVHESTGGLLYARLSVARCSSATIVEEHDHGDDYCCCRHPLLYLLLLLLRP